MMDGFMTWVVASLISAFLLGVYQLFTKHAVRDNAVLPVLFFVNLCSALVWIGLGGLQWALGPAFPEILRVSPLTGEQHLMLLGKSVIVASSWGCGYFAIKHLPVSIASPIRSTGPVWTLFGALLILGERPHAWQLVGVAVTLASFVALSLVGAREGIRFHRNKWIGWSIVGTLLGAASGLYDKFLLGHRGFDAATVQCWFSIYLAVVFLPLAIGWLRRWWPRNEFHWRGSIIGVSLALLAADFLYFNALRDPAALVALVSSIRRSSTLVTFVGGIWLFHEHNGRQKLPAVLGVVAGITLTVLG